MDVKKKLYAAVGLLFIVLSIGVSGYMIISGDNFIDALYMTVITVSTVGFGLIHPLSIEAKIFTIVLIFLSVFLYGYVLKVISENIAIGTFFKELKHKNMQKKIDNLVGHTVVCGYGRNGQQAVTKLKKFNQTCVVIEQGDDKLLQLEQEEILYLKGDATDDDVLEASGIEKAKCLIVALPSDADNLFVVLSARQLNKKITIISRASEESTYKKLKIAGADNVIMPDKLGGDHMASLVVTPDIIEFVDMLSMEGELSANLQEVLVDNLPSSYLKKSIRDLDLRKKTGCSVIGFKNGNNDYIVNPEADITLDKGSKLIVLGRPEQVEKLKSLY
ncbi:potassium channel family protein [Urechidicola vernalis]|uniref:Potassium channel protein n=1 Tax=Urechidicola vernalis TaxID=3075600 RepID=A0ABU2Y2M7_9FLAO|nr:potassium channel protein [Urechidicola sp. P050]MDT0552456.1 potassium channel protein [Urechidicola sp. P050]